jgi:hypothetical protein
MNNKLLFIVVDDNLPEYYIILENVDHTEKSEQ